MTPMPPAAFVSSLWFTLLVLLVVSLPRSFPVLLSKIWTAEFDQLFPSTPTFVVLKTIALIIFFKQRGLALKMNV